MNKGQIWVGMMMRIGVAAILVAIVSITWPAERAFAQSPSAGIKLAQSAADETRPVRRVYRPPTRLRVRPYYYQEQGVYPHYYPGPDAVRVCNARYVQEYRPSGAVIVPRMSCHWTRG